MIRSILLAVLAFVALGADAQPFQAPTTADNPCGFTSPVTIWPYGDLAVSMAAGIPVAATTCTPAPLGKGTQLTLNVNAAGIVGWYHCPQPDGRWRTTWMAETWASYNTHPTEADGKSIWQATDPVATLNAVLAQRVNTPLADPTLTPVWCPFARQMIASQPAPVMVPIDPLARSRAAVAPSNWKTLNTGPGTLHIAAPGRLVGEVPGRTAPRDKPCDCSGSVIPMVTIGTQTYCPLAPLHRDIEAVTNSEVTACRKVG